MIYPLPAFVVIVKSCAPIADEPPGVRFPNGMVVAVVVTFVVAPFTVPPEVTPATVKVRFGSTVAVTATEVVARIANAAEFGPSMVTALPSFVVISTK